MIQAQTTLARDLLAKENSGTEAIELYDGVLFIRKDVCIRAILSALQSSATDTIVVGGFCGLAAAPLHQEKEG